METFEEWYSNRFGEASDYNSQHTSREAWNHQQEKIERLEEKLKIESRAATHWHSQLVALKEREGE